MLFNNKSCSFYINRFNTVQTSVRTTEPLVTLRQSLLLLIQEAVPQVNLNQRLQKCWLERASIARQANQLANAYGMYSCDTDMVGTCYSCDIDMVGTCYLCDIDMVGTC